MPRLEDLWCAQGSVCWEVTETHRFIWHNFPDPCSGGKISVIAVFEKGQNPFPSPWHTDPGSAQSGDNSPSPCLNLGLKSPEPWTCCPGSQLCSQHPENRILVQKCFDVPAMLPLHCEILLELPSLELSPSPSAFHPKDLAANPCRLFLLLFSHLKVPWCGNCQETPSPRLGLFKVHSDPRELPEAHLEPLIRVRTHVEEMWRAAQLAFCTKFKLIILIHWLKYRLTHLGTSCAWNFCTSHGDEEELGATVLEK